MYEGLRAPDAPPAVSRWGAHYAAGAAARQHQKLTATIMRATRAGAAPLERRAGANLYSCLSRRPRHLGRLKRAPPEPSATLNGVILDETRRPRVPLPA